MEKSVPCTTASTMTSMKTENQDNTSSISTLVNGTILKTALTNPSEVTVTHWKTKKQKLFKKLRTKIWFVYSYTIIFYSGHLSQTKARQRCKLVKGPYVFNRSYGEYDQEPCGLRWISRYRYSKGMHINYCIKRNYLHTAILTHIVQ